MSKPQKVAGGKGQPATDIKMLKTFMLKELLV